MQKFNNYFILETKEKNKIHSIIKHLNKKKQVLLLTTSNRWQGSKDIPKSTQLANFIASKLTARVKIIDVTTLNIFPCEGNVSESEGNKCGVKKSILNNKTKNPSGCHRCWASLNNKDDELWKITKELLESDCVLFFGSVRWGQLNSVYQKLIERLTWLENRHTTLREDNILAKIEAGLMIVGQNWNGSNVVETQKQVLGFYGFKITNLLFWNWQYTEDKYDESQASYKLAATRFNKENLH